jgi:hypothetical protein
MLLVSWVSLAILNSTLALPMPEAEFDVQASELELLDDAPLLGLGHHDDARTEELDKALDSETVIDLSSGPFYADLLVTFKDGLVLFQEGTSRWSNFKVQMLGDSACYGMNARVNF